MIREYALCACASLLVLGVAVGARATDTHGLSVGAPANGTSSSGPVVVHTDSLTLAQAVARVRERTHGKVLRTRSRQYGEVTEYRIKVLTPDGHVRVMPVRPALPGAAPAHSSKETH